MDIEQNEMPMVSFLYKNFKIEWFSDHYQFFNAQINDYINIGSNESNAKDNIDLYIQSKKTLETSIQYYRNLGFDVNTNALKDSLYKFEVRIKNKEGIDLPIFRY